MKNQKPQHCVDDLTIGNEHLSKTLTGIQSAPEVFTFNLNWNDEPLPT